MTTYFIKNKSKNNSQQNGQNNRFQDLLVDEIEDKAEVEEGTDTEDSSICDSVNDKRQGGAGEVPMAKAEVNIPEHDTNNYPIYRTFDEMDLKDPLLRGIYSYGFEKPTAIQSKAIGPIIARADVIAQAQSGTGKTGAFSISTLQVIDTSPTKHIPACQALILAPVRELAEQTAKVVAAMGAQQGAIVACFTGKDESEYENKRKLQAGVHIVVGTPGRIQSLIEKGYLRTRNLKLLVIDEADEMLKIGFQPTLRAIIGELLVQCKCALFSATLPQEIFDTIRRFTTNPVKILIKKEEITLQGLKQYMVHLNFNEDNKLYCLDDLMMRLSPQQTIIFCNSRDRVDMLHQRLSRLGWVASMIHGVMEQKERFAAAREFRAGNSRVLVATDVLARGFDVQQVSLVINYDLPLDRENYIHRIGRAARMGRKGIAINFVFDNDMVRLRDLEHYYQTKIEFLPDDFDILNREMGV